MMNQSPMKNVSLAENAKPRIQNEVNANRKTVDAAVFNENLWRQIDRWVNEGGAVSAAVASSAPETGAVREAVGVFSRSDDLQDAIDELLSSGFHRAELSLLASEQVVEEKLGHRYEKVSALADDPTVPRAAYVSTEAIGDAEGSLIGGLMYVGAAVAAGAVVASGGTLAATIAVTALAGGAAGVVGSVLAKWIGAHHAHYLQEQMDRGGLLLWVHTRDVVLEKRAVEILQKTFGGRRPRPCTAVS